MVTKLNVKDVVVKMTSHNVLQPINCNIRDSDGSPLSKRPRREYNISTKHDTSQTWSLSSGPNELDILTEMGIGMLDTEEIADFKNDDYCQPSSSRINFGHNDQDYTNSSEECNTSTDIVTIDYKARKENICTATKETENKKELLKHSKHLENFCLYRRSSMMNEDSKDWFNSLSDEMILMIFRWLPKVHLSRCALVCKRWHRLSADETLWTRLDCSTKVLEPGSLGHILSRQIIILKLSQAEILSPPILQNVKANYSGYASKLMYLDLSMATVAPSTLAILFSKCSRLRKISLEFCEIDDDVCSQLGRNENLEVLNMTMVKGLTLIGIDHILENCPQIKELNLSWTSLTVDMLSYICTSLPICLSRLNLSGCRKTLNNTHIKELIACCPYLKELDLSDGTSLTNEAIKFILQLTGLNFLALSRCYGIQCSMLKKLTNMGSLQYLDIHGGHIEQRELDDLQQILGNKVQMNKFMFSSIARPTVGMKRSSIWGLRVRD